MIKFYPLFLFLLMIYSCSSYKRGCTVSLNKNYYSRHHRSGESKIKKSRQMLKANYIGNQQIDDIENIEWKYLHSLRHTRNINNDHQPSGGFEE